MQAGVMRKRVTLQSRATTQDAAGQQATTWADVATFWAQVEALSGREVLAAQAIQSQVSHRISLRYSPEFASPTAVSAMRLLYAGRIFNIATCMNVDERNRTIELMASEGLNNG